jgi:hypothetical protein
VYKCNTRSFMCMSAISIAKINLNYNNTNIIYINQIIRFLIDCNEIGIYKHNMNIHFDKNRYIYLYAFIEIIIMIAGKCYYFCNFAYKKIYICCHLQKEILLLTVVSYKLQNTLNHNNIFHL